ncbi:MAG: putative hydrolase [Amycolatopsis sp.]|jgi:glyoxylase-like metal-dependent hydrolase (beta-lactamase superfamily II)|uniref:MBL fold metallo-hydrolase n=1 Tax=Amycolatopsis sp. TaxID=37632 RepID=UPI00262E2191|nr:MBL fold metallo-hydrolase [Amycolatopsis sp.]MCU1679480.1 putative hydrolase [Amycolatopsis sp.]
MAVDVDLTVTAGNYRFDGASFAVDTNIWLIGDEHEVLIVDAGFDATSIEAAVDGRDVVGIVCTHAHNDHADAALTLADATGAPVLLHPDDAKLWARVNPGRLPDAELADRQVLTVAGTSVLVLHTPGHTAGSVCLYLPDEGVLFSGDTLLSGGPGMTGDVLSSRSTLLESIHRSLLVLPDETVVHPGHGYDTDLGTERSEPWATAVKGSP